MEHRQNLPFDSASPLAIQPRWRNIRPLLFDLTTAANLPAGLSHPLIVHTPSSTQGRVASTSCAPGGAALFAFPPPMAPAIRADG